MDQLFVKSWQDARRVVVSVGAYDERTKQPLCVGTGVIVMPNMVLTAAHVIDEIEQLGVRPYVLMFEHSVRADGIVDWKLGLSECETSRWADRDMGVLTLHTPIPSVPRMTSPLARTILSARPPQIGELVDSYGMPPTHFETYEGARIGVAFSGMVHIGREVTDASEQAVLVTHPNPKGMSGGPLFDSDGALVGIASETICQPDAMLSKTHALMGKALYVGLADVVAQLFNQHAATEGHGNDA